MTTKSLAVKEVISIYKSHLNKTDRVLEALGQVGGDEAVKEILEIYKAHPHKIDKVLVALGNAGKNSA